MESKARRKSHNRAVAFAMAVLMLGTSGYSALPESISTSITANAVTTTEVPEGYTAVSTVEDLYAIRANPSGKYILMNDIDLSETAKGGDWDGGNGWTPIPSFSGILDGNGYTVSNMNIFGTNIYAGFIKNNAGEIKNISFDGVAINRLPRKLI